MRHIQAHCDAIITLLKHIDNKVNFCRYWCVKESFVKAIGTGVGYKLDGIEFHQRDWTNIRVKINGKEMKDWKFWLLSIGKNYAVRY